MDDVNWGSLLAAAFWVASWLWRLARRDRSEPSRPEEEADPPLSELTRAGTGVARRRVEGLGELFGSPSGAGSESEAPADRGRGPTVGLVHSRSEALGNEPLLEEGGSEEGSAASAPLAFRRPSVAAAGEAPIEPLGAQRPALQRLTAEEIRRAWLLQQALGPRRRSLGPARQAPLPTQRSKPRG